MRLTLFAIAGASILAMPGLALADSVVVNAPAPPAGQVVVQPGQPAVVQSTQPCRSKTTTTTNNNTGASHTKQTTNCPE